MRVAGLAALLLTPIALAACGEREFDAHEFVAEANANGAGLELGDPLLSSRDETKIYAVEVKPTAATGETGDAAGGNHEHTGGSLIVAPDVEAGEEEYERCEGAVTIVCYRAANVVLALEGEAQSPELVGVDGAIRALANG